MTFSGRKGKTNGKEETVQIGDWQVERRLVTARIEGGGPLNVAEECGGHCCLHGVYASLPERDRILEHADRIREVMDGTQPSDTDLWFEDGFEEDPDYPGGLCVGTAVYGDKCAFLNADGLCVLQKLEAELELPRGERLKPFYCYLFPLTTWYNSLEFDDLCDGVRPCCTLASDGTRPAVDAWEFEFRQVLGDRGYEQLRRVADELMAAEEASKASRR